MKLIESWKQRYAEWQQRRDTARLLDEAVDYIEEHGWIQGKWRDPQTGAVCAEGALRMVAGVGKPKDGDLDLDKLYKEDWKLVWNTDDKNKSVAGLRYYRAIGELETCIRAEHGKNQGVLSWNDGEPHQTKEKVCGLMRRCARVVRRGRKAQREKVTT